MSIVEKSLQKYREVRADNAPAAGRGLDATGGAGAPEPAGGPADRRRVPRTEPPPPRFFETLKPQVVQMDPERLRSLGLYPSVESEAAIQDQFRRVKWPLLEMAIGRKAHETPNGRLILVTSSLADEGKTFCAVNLALSIARERDIAVVLIDGDVRKAHISSSLGVENQPGLVELVEDASMSLRDVCLRTTVPQLFLLPAGRFNGDVPEHWASARMQAIMDELSQLDRQSIVVMDSAPILLTNDTQVLTRLVGQVAYIVRANWTLRSVVSDGIALIDQAPVVSCVLNQSSEAPSGYYGYGKYPYGKDSRTGPAAAASPKGDAARAE